MLHDPTNKLLASASSRNSVAISGREFGVHVLWMRCSQSVVIKIEPNPRDPPSRLAIAQTIPADWNSVWLDFGFEAPWYREYCFCAED